jgi:hypothetical protein
MIPTLAVTAPTVPARTALTRAMAVGMETINAVGKNHGSNEVVNEDHVNNEVVDEDHIVNAHDEDEIVGETASVKEHSDNEAVNDDGNVEEHVVKEMSTPRSSASQIMSMKLPETKLPTIPVMSRSMATMR